MEKLFQGIYAGRRVLVTGHTGFKGSWLALWLKTLGAEVTGFSLPPPTEPNHFSGLALGLDSVIGDITDRAALSAAVQAARPEIVFHLAAQAIVRESYTNPVDTYAANVMGTLHLCEACRATTSVRAIVSITTDKVYQNREWWWGYREIDELGGYDPYSASKACADILLASYRNSFYSPAKYGNGHETLLAVTRAGNVIGGGDWARDRLIPDLARAASRGEALTVRNPQATRPWQHVLECLAGYLLVGQKLLEKNAEYGTAFNFGPPPGDVQPVAEIVRRMQRHWPELAVRDAPQTGAPHEARILTLDCAKAAGMLAWAPVWNIDTALERTALWYREFYQSGALRSVADLERYVADATAGGAVWAR